MRKKGGNEAGSGGDNKEEEEQNWEHCGRGEPVSRTGKKERSERERERGVKIGLSGP